MGVTQNGGILSFIRFRLDQACPKSGRSQISYGPQLCCSCFDQEKEKEEEKLKLPLLLRSPISTKLNPPPEGWYQGTN